MDDIVVDIRSKWLTLGWKRGAFIDVNNYPNLLNELPTKLKEFCSSNQNVYLVPVLYDCALVDGSFEKEPWVQAVLGIPCRGDGNFKNGRNPRRLHLPVQIAGQDDYLEFSALGFLQIDREILLSESEPSDTIIWVNNSRELLLDWVADRFRMATFPDEFNKRIETKLGALKKLWKKDIFRDYCSGIYIRINTDKELDTLNERYRVDLIIVIPDLFSPRKLRETGISDKLHIDLTTIFSSIQGIQVIDARVLPEGEFTKTLEREFRKLSLEYYSYSSNDDTPIPAERLESKVSRFIPMKDNY
ncbi:MULTISPECIES: hypothetical protein [Gammaproteobacteria]|uniref:hypothetical protein n=1 Tax=Gammaproteobacteria TaxID=1236 RepID=UPI000D92113F|nr:MULTISPECIES: hypothetical protein [Gammaproteobacteria]MBP6518335.1 hypothetical protein [Shewanella sp.]SPY70800.1 Uncharacterised protein [Providencia alcalifaciens]